jgi:hypothetical protein
VASFISSGGFFWIISAIQGPTGSNVSQSYINWGLGTISPGTASVSISNETGSRVAASSSNASGGIAACWSGTLTAASIFTASDVALFTCSNSGTNGMVLYGSHAPVPLEASDRI